MVGLGTEDGLWLYTHQSMQSATDAAAFSAAQAYAANGSGSPSLSGGTAGRNVAAEARAVAAQYGFVSGQNNTTVTVNQPPTSGSHTASSNGVEVIITQQQTRLFSALWNHDPVTIKGRSVALGGGGGACVIALDTSAKGSLAISGSGTDVDIYHCGIAVNSSNSAAMTMSGCSGGGLTADSVTVHGNYTNSGCTYSVTTTKTSAAVTPDPYASLALPSFSGCDHSNYSISNGATATVSPGVYCDGISVSGGATLNLNPGVYVINHGNLNVNSGTFQGTNVSIVMTSTTGSWGTINIGSSTFSITAPTTGAMAGIAIYVDRNAPTSGNDFLSGGSTQQIKGAVYIPTQQVQYTGGGTNAQLDCIQLVARLIKIQGSSKFGASACGNIPVAGLQSGSTALVE